MKPAAFIPSPYVELSVSRTLGLEDNAQEIWRLGEEVAQASSKTLYGRAEITAQHFRSQHLDVIPSEPPLRHANAVNWPDHPDRKEQKALQKDIALELAACARLVMRE